VKIENTAEFAILAHAGRLAAVRRDARNRGLQLLQVTADRVQETLASLGQSELARAAVKQPYAEIPLSIATLRLTAAGVSDSRRAAVEKPPVSALVTKDSRFASVSTVKPSSDACK
jgi:hypothetical protein